MLHLIPLLQAAAAAPVPSSPLVGTAAEWLWAVPLLPLLGFVINGALSMASVYHRGPADPFTPHDAHDAHPSDANHASHADAHVAAGDDHPPVQRHRFATIASIVGPGVLVLSFLLTLAIFFAMRAAGGGEIATPFVQRYFSWMPVGDLQINAAFQLDQLSMMMTLVVTGVGMLIHLFSIGYMRDDPGYPRFFAYLNLFVFF
ncbi:MAG: hypothetical protein ABI205_01275, partial [Gemmatimonadaceae bacterium]